MSLQHRTFIGVKREATIAAPDQGNRSFSTDCWRRLGGSVRVQRGRMRMVDNDTQTMGTTMASWKKLYFTLAFVAATFLFVTLF